ncbi:MAG: YbaB/EbfC family nucleoid-associated protein [Elusimicrobiales bacterium]
MLDKIKELMQLKSKMEEMKKQLDAETVEAASGDGLVHVKMNGSQRVTEVKINSAGAQPQALEQAVRETVNRAIELSMQLAAKKMGAVAGLNFPGA